LERLVLVYVGIAYTVLLMLPLSGGAAIVVVAALLLSVDVGNMRGRLVRR